MFYSRATLSEIEDLKDSSKLFSILIEPTYRGDYPYWKDIWDGMKFFGRHNSLFDSLFDSIYFYDEKKLKDLEKLGLDYNYRDTGGNNFFQYAIGISKTRSSESKDPNFARKAIEYIISKTEDICKPNNFNRNVLFDMLSYSAAGINGEEFFEFLEKYPGLDIHLVDKAGKNLMFEALLRPAPFPVINYLIENGISLTQVDNDNHNLIHIFFSFGKSKESIKLFDLLFESVDDISLKSKYGDSAIEFFITCAIDDKVHQDSRQRYNFWALKSLEKIEKGEFKKTEQCLNNMINVLEEHKDKYKSYSLKEDVLAYEMALKSLNYFLLDMTMTNNNGITSKKFKI